MPALRLGRGDSSTPPHELHVYSANMVQITLADRSVGSHPKDLSNALRSGGAKQLARSRRNTEKELTPLSFSAPGSSRSTAMPASLMELLLPSTRSCRRAGTSTACGA